MQLDETARKNQQRWDAEVAKGVGYTRPHLQLDPAEFRAFSEGRTDKLPEFAPWELERLCRNAAGKDVLCLASGGGQQSALFGLLGAKVTVLDLCEGQLRGDRQAAEHYGYEVTTVQGDMRDLSPFADESFNLVIQGISIVFVPDVREVYREVHRVLRPGGLYEVSQCNPTTFPACFTGGSNGWDGIGYRIADPYVGGPILRDSDGAENMLEGEPTGEFRHLLRDIFNGLIELGFVIQGVWEAERHLNHNPNAGPGTEEHINNIIAEYFDILAQKP